MMKKSAWTEHSRRIWAKGGNFMQRREQSMMIQVKSVQELQSKVVDLYKAKKNELESLKSDIHNLDIQILPNRCKIKTT